MFVINITIFHELAFVEEDCENILHARATEKGVLTSSFTLESKHHGVVLTFTVYKIDLPQNATLVDIRKTNKKENKHKWKGKDKIAFLSNNPSKNHFGKNLIQCI